MGKKFNDVVKHVGKKLTLSEKYILCLLTGLGVSEQNLYELFEPW